MYSVIMLTQNRNFKTNDFVIHADFYARNVSVIQHMLNYHVCYCEYIINVCKCMNLPQSGD